MNLVVMVLLCVAVMGFAIVMAIQGTSKDAGYHLDKKVSSLVSKLGDDDSHERENAERELIRIGKAALPKLNAAVKSTNIDIANRSRKIVEAIEHPGEASPVEP